MLRRQFVASILTLPIFGRLSVAKERNDYAYADTKSWPINFDGKPSYKNKGLVGVYFNGKYLSGCIAANAKEGWVLCRNYEPVLDADWYTGNQTRKFYGKVQIVDIGSQDPIDAYRDKNTYLF